MSVAASCDALYFPNVPKDNIITLKYNAEGAALQPNTLVLFKVKTSAPALFHVLPRYGAQLVADPSGSCPEGFKGGSIAFALREHYANSGRGDDGEEGDANGTPARPSAAGTDGDSPGTAPRFQERFAIEYVVLHNESLAYQQVAHCLTEPTRLAEAAKSVWTLTTAGAIPKAHIGIRSTINLRAYLRNVVLQASDPSPIGDEKGKVVVPPNATLVDPCMHERLGSAARTPTSISSGGRRGLGGPAGRGGKGSAADELRALRDEVQQRRESIQQCTSPSLTPNKPSAATSNRASTTSAPAARGQPAAAASGNAAHVMTLPLHNKPRVKSSSKGIKTYLVVLMMVIVYVCALWSRRGHGPVPQIGSDVVMHGGKGTRSVNEKGPLGLPSTNSTVAVGRKAR